MFRRHALLVAGCIYAALALPARAEEAIHWAPNLSAAINMASRQNQLVLIHFWAPNCPPCRAVDREVFTRPDVAAAIHRDFVPVRVNAAAMPDTARKYGVDRWPMDVIITPAGYAIHSMVSPSDPRQYMQALHRVAADRQPGRTLTAAGPSAEELGGVRQDQPVQAGGQTERRWDEPSQGHSFAPQPTRRYGEQPPQHYEQPQHGPRHDDGLAQSQRYSQFSHLEGGDARWQDQGPPQGDGFGARSGGQQLAPYGREYATSHDQGYGSRPREDRPAGPQETRNPYMADRRDGNPAGAESLAAPLAGPQTESPREGGAPPLGLEGYCPVTLVQHSQWAKGDKRHGLIHRGQLYLFVGEAEKQRFWQDPDLYAPILGGNDPVAFVESGQLIAGMRRHGVFFHNQVYLFTGEESLDRFWRSPERYAEAAQHAMRRTAHPQRR